MFAGFLGKHSIREMGTYYIAIPSLEVIEINICIYGISVGAILLMEEILHHLGGIKPCK